MRRELLCMEINEVCNLKKKNLKTVLRKRLHRHGGVKFYLLVYILFWHL